MSILTTSWRQSLAATALLAFLGPGSDALADEGSREETVEVTIESEASDDGEEPVLAVETEVDEVDEREQGEPVEVERVEKRQITRQVGPNTYETEEREIVVRGQDESREEKERRAQEDGLSRLRQIETARDELLRQARDQLDQEARREALERLAPLRREIAEFRRHLAKGGLSRDQRKRLADLEKQFVGIDFAHPIDFAQPLEVRQPEVEHEREAKLNRRLEHMYAAAKNLHEAGLHDQAEQLLRQAKEMERQTKQANQQAEQMEKKLLEQRGYVDKARVQYEEASRHGEKLEQAIGELREQLNQMRKEMEEMRRAFKTAIQRLERDHPRERGREDDDANEQAAPDNLP